ncbi:MAG TPA: hypothetical protein VNO52_07625 [Methylomirabilota bacterium]|nr:hypothetical protein [Methylomirabilota bacterium]
MLRDLVFHNVWLKLFSLVLATLIWLAVGYNPTLTTPTAPIAPAAVRVFEVCPVGILHAAGEGRPLRVEPSHVRVTIRGTASQVGGVVEEEVHAFVRIPAGRPAIGPFAVEVVVPGNVSVAEVVPSAVNVKPASPP